jgi:RNA polymerase sigma-70 factor (ECF subfamily)
VHSEAVWVVGAEAVAGTFAGRAQAARLATIDGLPGAVWIVGGEPRVVFEFEVRDGLITTIRLIGDPAELAGLDLELA